MAQREFGRRQVLAAGAHSETTADAAAPVSADVREALALADAPSRSAMRSVLILAAVGGLVVLTALGAAYGLHAAIPSGEGTEAAKPQECRSQSNCVNQYNVTLTCGASDQPKTVTIEARDAEAAERKAERYNRDCRSRRAVFVASLVRNSLRTAYGGHRYEEPARNVTRKSTGALRLRFRRR